MTDRKDVMLCYPFEEKRLHKYSKPWIVQPKLEGDRCRAIGNVNGWTLVSSQGNPRDYAVPLVLRDLKFFWPTPIELDGELYVHGMEHQDIRSIVSRTQNRHPDHLKMEYHIFDIASNMPQYERLKELERLFDPNPSICLKPVMWYICGTLDEVYMYYKEFTTEGYEGIIIRDAWAPYVRKRTTTMMKLKPRKSMLAVVVGHYEELSIQGEPKGALGGLEVQNSSGVQFCVGSGFKRDERISWWHNPEALHGRIIRVYYQDLTKDGIPKFPTFKEFVNGHES